MNEKRIEELEAACKLGMSIAQSKPGKYGGCYLVLRDPYGVCDDLPFAVHWVGDNYGVIESDDPDCDYVKGFDVIASVSPSDVIAIGFCRAYLRRDGTVDRDVVAAGTN